MDERAVERPSDDPSRDWSEPSSDQAPEPRSYDPFDEVERGTAPSWDSWSNQAADFPVTSVTRPEGSPDPAPYRPEPDTESTQAWSAVDDEDESAFDPNDPPDHAQLDHGQLDHAQHDDDGFDPEATAEYAVLHDDEDEDEDEQASSVATHEDATSGTDPEAGDGTPAASDHHDVAGFEGWHDHVSEDDDGGEPTQRVDLPQVAPDQMIADRFRLEQQLADRHGFLTWRAFDVKLSRPVLVHLLSKHDPRSGSVLEAAREAATVTDSSFLRVLDAATVSDDISYVVCEYVVGKSLEVLLAEGPLSGLEAAWVLREVARAMAPVHQRGLFHLRLNPDTIIISSTGNVRIVGLLIDAALTPRPDDAVSKQELQELDVHALGQLLYAMLVSRWPVMPDEQLDRGQRHFGLAAAPMDAEGWLTPRQVRAGVSPALDQLADEVLHAEPRLGGEPLTTAAQIDEALEKVLGTADASSDLSQRVRHAVRPVEPTDSVVPLPPSSPRSPDQRRGGSGQGGSGQGGHADRPAAVGATPEQPRRRPPARRIWLRVLLALIALVLLVSLIAVGIRNGRTAAEGPASSAPPSPTVHPISKVDDFDPEADGGNGEESPNAVALAWDKKPSTVWVTNTYRNNAKLGLLKPGVGLVVDLGQVVEVGKVNLTLQGSPTAVSIMIPKAGSREGLPPSMTTSKDWTSVASSASAGTSARFTLKSPTQTRYLLVYLTSLPNVGGNQYRGAIAEIEVTS